MSHTKIALKVLAAMQCKDEGIKTNNDFWKKYSDQKDFEEKFSQSPQMIEQVDYLSDKLAESTIDSDWGFVCVYDDEFPVINPKVKNNREKPFILFYRGDLSLLKTLNNNVAVIGLVDPTEEIKERESVIVQQLIQQKLVIVSGLAHGCDTIAHQVCVDFAGKTIAILPTQTNKIYPAENRKLADEILTGGGLLLSEYYTEPCSKFEATKRLIDRDRLQTMFSKAVILIASYKKDEGDSGSRHAMEAAKKYGVDRFVMYNSKTDENNKLFGLNQELIKDDAKILLSSSINNIKELHNHNLEKAPDRPVIKQLMVSDYE